MASNSENFLHKAGLLIKGEIADANETIKTTREARDKAVWQAICNLFCHAVVNIFADGYSKAAAAKFKAEVAENCNIKEKQAGKYTETISAALAMRGTRAGIKAGIPGVYEAAQEGPDTVFDFFAKLAEPVNTLGGLQRLIRKPVNVTQKVAEAFAKLDETDRDTVLKLVKRMDENAAKAQAAADKRAASVNGHTAQASA